MKSPWLEGNLSALRFFNPRTAEALESLQPGCEVAMSKSGHPVPVLPQVNLPLHSLYDPVREAQKGLAEVSSPCVVFFGFGGGYWVRQALRTPERQLVAVVDLQPAVTRAVLEAEDFSGLFLDPRLRFLSSPEEIATIYHPGLMGSLQCQVLAPLERWNPGLMSEALEQFRSALDRVVSDQVVQGKFGRRWMLQTWRNLRNLEDQTLNFPRDRRIWVAGAGPSLEVQLEKYAPGDLIFAADTALPCLQALGRDPDLVLTLDPQYYSLLHFLPGKTQGVLLLELGTHPALLSRGTRILYFFSHHPLHRWLRSQGVDLPLLETRAGNVIGPLLDLAWSFHPKEVLLAGADQAYPQGQLYARDTYQYHYHGIRSHRFSPLETAQTDFLFRSPLHSREEGIYLTEGQVSTREKLSRQSFPGKITQPPGKSPPLLFLPPTADRSQGPLVNKNASYSGLKNRYLDLLKKLSPEYPWLAWISHLNQEERGLFETLVPWFSWRSFHGRENKEEKWPIILKEIEEYLEN